MNAKITCLDTPSILSSPKIIFTAAMQIGGRPLHSLWMNDRVNERIFSVLHVNSDNHAVSRRLLALRFSITESQFSITVFLDTNRTIPLKICSYLSCYTLITVTRLEIHLCTIAIELFKIAIQYLHEEEGSMTWLHCNGVRKRPSLSRLDEKAS